MKNKMKLHEIKYEARKRRHHPKDDAEIKLYHAIYYQRRWPLWDVRHMEVFKNGTVAQFVNKRQDLIIWIDDHKTSIPDFPKKFSIYCLSQEFILQKTIEEINLFLEELFNIIAQERIAKMWEEILKGET